MEETTISNNNPDYTREYSEVNPAYADEENNEHKREAICKRCGAVWHPRKTDARRPTRCPYCQSHRTEWLDEHPELIADADESRQEDEDAEMEIEVSSLESSGLNREDTLEDEVETEDETEEESSENSKSSQITPKINPDYSLGRPKQQGIPIAALYLVLGVILAYGLIRIWNSLRKPSQKKETHSRPADAAFATENITAPLMTETSHMGLAEMAMKQHHLL